MNVVPGTALADHAALAARLAGHDPSRLDVGVRPHECTIGATRAGDAVPVSVALVEPGGPESWVIAGHRGERFRARLARGESLAPGDSAYLSFGAEAVHLFDKETGGRMG
jgi:multiple sugar transport system ATP-binding protein